VSKLHARRSTHEAQRASSDELSWIFQREAIVAQRQVVAGQECPNGGLGKAPGAEVYIIIVRLIILLLAVFHCSVAILSRPLGGGEEVTERVQVSDLQDRRVVRILGESLVDRTTTYSPRPKFHFPASALREHQIQKGMKKLLGGRSGRGAGHKDDDTIAG